MSALPTMGKSAPDYMTDDVVISELRKHIQELTRERTAAIQEIRVIVDMLQSMNDAWEEQASALMGNESEPNRRKRSHDNGYAGALIQTSTELRGLLKSIRSRR